MQTIREKLVLLRPCDDDAVVTCTLGELRAAVADARALWAVRVLDAWSDTGPRRSYYVTDTPVGEFWCKVFDTEAITAAFTRPGTTRDAARLAAAEAVFPELPEAVRAELGERP